MARHSRHHLENFAVNSIDTGRLTVCVRELADRVDGRPLVLVHGNVSSSPFFFPLMAGLEHEAPRIRPIAVDLRGFGGTDTLPVDATRGLSDFADDVWSAVDALGLGQVDLLGWSMGGGVVLQMICDRPADVRTATLINPLSPYGFGGTVGVDGRLIAPDGAGSGAGTVNPDFVEGLRTGDDGTTSAASPLTVLRSFYVAPGWDGADEELYLASMLSTAVGEDNYPGDSTTSPSWPGVAPGRRGVLNTMAPTHLDLSAVTDVEPKPPLLWLRGELDQIVSDTSMFDLAHLGALGAVPGYPGADRVPAQPMVAQTRSVLDAYRSGGGVYTETVVAGAGHSPHIERTDEVLGALLMHLDA
ncbi:alpha/beta hydrolase [Nakamurella endophytica]|uniref:Alpha/beta hydrolase n=1 Tax=Nakamurella endophytica TaxID=1748367 RepID=A0A917T418_9ACTN|nr:alpha/beta fold hydrolase [Nakamurella endophytica]GGM08359.1 alpha/beta hydrolase [Nakamurella endophytica]